MYMNAQRAWLNLGASLQLWVDIHLVTESAMIVGEVATMK